MNIRLYLVMISALLISLAPAARAEQLVQEFSGSGTTNSADFEVQAPWILDWRVGGEQSRVVAVDISLVNADTGAYEGKVLQSKNPGNGVRLFNEGGRYYFRIDATLMDWTLKVIQLTREEAEQYKPKSKSLLDH